MVIFSTQDYQQTLPTTYAGISIVELYCERHEIRTQDLYPRVSEAYGFGLDVTLVGRRLATGFLDSAQRLATSITYCISFGTQWERLRQYR